MKATPDHCSEEIARVLRSNLPTLSSSEAGVAAEWLVGIVFLLQCGLTAVITMLAFLSGQQTNTVCQRLREFYQPSTQKRGRKRRVLRVSQCFKDLLRWIARLWSGKHICIALDAIFCKDDLVVLCYLVLYRGCAIPFSWKVLRANRKGAHLPAILTMLRRFKGIIPPSMTVLFLSDRGLWSPELFYAVRSIVGWYPMMRVQAGAYFRPKRASKQHQQLDWQKLTTLISEGDAAKETKNRGSLLLTCRHINAPRRGMGCGCGLNRALRPLNLPDVIGSIPVSPNLTALNGCGWSMLFRLSGFMLLQAVLKPSRKTSPRRFPAKCTSRWKPSPKNNNNNDDHGTSVCIGLDK